MKKEQRPDPELQGPDTLDVCEDCERPIPARFKGYTISVEGDERLVCDECLEKYVQCERCGEYTLDYYNIYDQKLCDICYSE